MKHIINYDILKDWGFAWATTKEYPDGEIVVDSYLQKDTTHTDAHDFRDIILSLLYHPNFSPYWVLSYSNAETEFDVLFRGMIQDDKTLECILESCLVYKPCKK
jgi:hypothetical protein